MESMEEYLKNLFNERCRLNKQYSLRAFAKSIELAPSTLSELMSGKRKLSKVLRDRIGNALEMDTEQVKAFEAKAHGNSNQVDESLNKDYQSLALDSFYLISQWYHYAILQLLKTKNFKNNKAWIATRLAITPEEADAAIKRLLRIGIVELQNGKLVDVTNGQTTHLKNNYTNAQLRNFQIKALQIAIDKLKEVPIDFRDNTTMTFALNKESIPFAKKEITKFRRKLTKQLEQFGKPDEVYQLAIALSPLSNINEKIK